MRRNRGKGGKRRHKDGRREGIGKSKGRFKKGNNTVISFSQQGFGPSRLRGGSALSLCIMHTLKDLNPGGGTHKVTLTYDSC